MPFPLIPVVIGAAVLVVGAVAVPVTVKKVREALKDKNVAILGREKVGKSTLINFLKTGTVSARSERALDPRPGENFRLRLRRKGEVRFAVPSDLSGRSDPSNRAWRTAFEAADFVWYLFRSDLIASGDPHETELVRAHLGHLGDWYSELQNRNAAPRVILVGVFADQDPTFIEGGGFEDGVRSTEVIRDASIRLGPADLVVGSLESAKRASELVKRIGVHLP